MSGLFRRLSSRRSAGPEGEEPQTAAQPGAADAPATTPAEPEGHRSLLADPAAETRDQPAAGEQPAPDDQPTELLPSAGEAAEPAPAAEPTPATPHVADAAVPLGAEPTPPVGAAPLGAAPAPYVAPGEPGPMPVTDLPAGLDPDELNDVPATSARRGKLRRRIAFLRAAREVLLRDLGGFVYELHRTAHDIEHEAHRRLRDTKMTRLSRVDAELHELEYRLDDVRRQVVVREPGVGGECPQCSELFGSAAHYCSQCGLPLTESARREQARARQPEPLPDPVVAPAPEAVAPAAITDQPTQELPPLDPDAGFEWPRREAASWTAEPSGLTTDAASHEVTAIEDAPPSDEVAGSDIGLSEPDPAPEPGQDAAGEAEPPDATPSVEAAQPDADATPNAEAAQPDTDETPNAEAAQPDADETPNAEAAPPDAEAAPTGDEPAPPDAGDDVPPAADAAASGDEPAAAGESAPDDDPQPNGSVFSPVERRP